MLVSNPIGTVQFCHLTSWGFMEGTGQRGGLLSQGSVCSSVKDPMCPLNAEKETERKTERDGETGQIRRENVWASDL